MATPAAFKAWYAKVKALKLEGDVLSELGRDMHSKGSLPQWPPTGAPCALQKGQGGMQYQNGQYQSPVGDPNQWVQSHQQQISGLTPPPFQGIPGQLQLGASPSQWASAPSGFPPPQGAGQQGQQPGPQGAQGGQPVMRPPYVPIAARTCHRCGKTGHIVKVCKDPP